MSKNSKQRFRNNVFPSVLNGIAKVCDNNKLKLIKLSDYQYRIRSNKNSKYIDFWDTGVVKPSWESWNSIHSYDFRSIKFLVKQL